MSGIDSTAMTELPETIFVKTCVVNANYAVEKKLQNFYALTSTGKLRLMDWSQPLSAGPSVAELTIRKDGKADRAINTDYSGLSNLSRERSIQTERQHNKDAAIQCNMEVDENESNMQDEPAADLSQCQQQYQVETEKFLEYVAQYSYAFTNGKQECRICGEITNTKRGMQRHLAVHWGPSAMCAVCGVKLEHEILLQHHQCTAIGMRRQHNRYKCPLYTCNVYALSPMELYDHINEHTKQLRYSCGNCQRSFSTAGELLLHCDMRKVCMRKSKMSKFRYFPVQNKAETIFHRRSFTEISGKKKRRLIVKKKLSHHAYNKQRLLCSVCMKHSSNKWLHKRHLRRCLFQHKQRIRLAKKKLLNQNKILKTDNFLI